MNFQEARIAIRTYFDSVWSNQTPVAHDDVEFTPPANKTDPWVRLNIAHVLGYQGTLGAPGANNFRREGIITAQVFQPEGQAGNVAAELSDSIVAIFQSKLLGPIRFQNVRVNEIGNDRNGYYQINVKTDFIYDTIA